MTVKEDNIKLVSPLKNKKVTIGLIKRRQSSLYNDIDLSTLATGGKKSFMCPIGRNNRIINPLTKEEQLYLESVTGEDLNPSKEGPNNFYTNSTGRVTLIKHGKNTESANLVLDLSDPYDYILYKIALINPRVANTWVEKDYNKEYEFVIMDGEVQLEEELNFTRKEDDVQEYLRKHRGSKRKLFDLLRMYGIENANQQVNYNNTLEWMYNELKKATRKKSEIKKLYSLITLGEKEISDKIFIADCITLALLEKRGYEYRLSGGDKIANNEMEAIAWFNDVRNNSVKMRFEQIIEDFYTNTNKKKINGK